MRVLITGATAGIGLSCAKALCEEGHDVIGVARSEAALDDIGEHHRTFHGIACDLAADEAGGNLDGELSALIGAGEIDVLINNAGYGAAGPVELVSTRDWKAQFNLNIFGTIAVTQAALPYLRRATNARVINISSIVSKIYAPCFAPYYSSKHALENITDILRLELKPQGIHVVSVRPGAVLTGFGNAEDAMLERYAGESALYRDSIMQMIKWHQSIVHDGGIEADKVRDVILKAVMAPRPKPRYTIPAFPANVVVPLLQLLPAKLGDALVSAITGFRTKPG